MQRQIAIPLQDRGLIGIAGSEARQFLQGLISNDIGKVTPNRAIYTSLLTPQGKFLHDFFVAQLCIKGESELLAVDCEGHRQEDLEKRLSMYRLRADVSFTDLSKTHYVSALIGEESITSLGLRKIPGEAVNLVDGIAYVDPRIAAMGVRAILPKDLNPFSLTETEFLQGDRADYDKLRLEHGIPDGSRDIIVGKFFPLECGLEELNGIDYEKGCYVGQELTARTHYRGTIRKRLMRVNVDGPLPEAGTLIFSEGKTVGELRTGREGKAIAMIRLEYVNPENSLEAGDARITPVRPSWANF